MDATAWPGNGGIPSCPGCTPTNSRDLPVSGLHGCIETFISGTGLEADYERATKTRLTGKEIIARCEAGEAAAEASLERYEDRLTRSLSQIVNILDPDVIVLGGGVSQVPR